jgi:hypothetical protein
MQWSAGHGRRPHPQVRFAAHHHQRAEARREATETITRERFQVKM